MNYSKEDIIKLLRFRRKKPRCFTYYYYCDSCIIRKIRREHVFISGCSPQRNNDMVDAILNDLEREDPILLFECQLLSI
jgi:hypothetical protein